MGIFHYDHDHGDHLQERAIRRPIAHDTNVRLHIIIHHEGPTLTEAHSQDVPDKDGYCKADLVVKGALSRDKYTNAYDYNDIDFNETQVDKDLAVGFPSVTQLLLKHGDQNF